MPNLELAKIHDVWCLFLMTGNVILSSIIIIIDTSSMRIALIALFQKIFLFHSVFLTAKSVILRVDTSDNYYVCDCLFGDVKFVARSMPLIRELQKKDLLK